MDIPRSIISHALRKGKDRRSELTCDVLVGVLKNNSLPTPAEQANNFITFLGEHLSSPGDRYEPSLNKIRSKIYMVYSALRRVR